MLKHYFKRDYCLKKLKKTQKIISCEETNTLTITVKILSKGEKILFYSKVF